MTTRNRIRYLASFCLALGVMAPASVAVAAADSESVVRARDLYARAQRMEAEKKYEEGRKLMQEAWSAHQHWEIAAFLAYFELETGRYRESAEHSAYALRTITADASASDRKNIDEQYAAAKAKVATVQVRGIEGGTKAMIDGRARDAASVADPLFLDPGQHEIEARRQNGPSVKRTIVAEAGKSLDVDLSPSSSATGTTANGAANTSKASTTPPEYSLGTEHATRGWTARTWVPLIEGTLAVAALGVGAGFVLQANSLNNEARDELAALKRTSSVPCANGNSQCDLRQKYSDRDNAATIAKVGLVTGGVLGVATLATVLLWPTRSGKAAGSGSGAAGGGGGVGAVGGVGALGGVGRCWVSPSVGTGNSAADVTGITVGGVF